MVLESKDKLSADPCSWDPKLSNPGGQRKRAL